MHGATTDWLGGVTGVGDEGRGGDTGEWDILFALWVDLNQRDELNVNPL